METSRLTCISPLPDTRRDSVDENFFNSINLPAPRQFADSRRSSGVPEVIQEMEEGASGETVYRVGRLSLSGGANIDDAGNRLSPSSEAGENTPTERKVDFLRVPIMTSEPIVDPLSNYRPIEVFERTYYMAREMDKDKERTASGQVESEKEEADVNEKSEPQEPHRALVHTCNLQVPGIVVTPQSQNVYTSENFTIIDTDAQTNTVWHYLTRYRERNSIGSSFAFAGTVVVGGSGRRGERCAVRHQQRGMQCGIRDLR